MEGMLAIFGRRRGAHSWRLVFVLAAGRHHHHQKLEKRARETNRQNREAEGGDGREGSQGDALGVATLLNPLEWAQ